MKFVGDRTRESRGDLAEILRLGDVDTGRFSRRGDRGAQNGKLPRMSVLRSRLSWLRGRGLNL